MNHSRHILNITATLFAMICFAIGECQAKTSLYSPHDGDLSFIVSNLVIDKNGSDNDSLPRRAQKKSRTKRDSINAAEVKGKGSGSFGLQFRNDKRNHIGQTNRGGYFKLTGEWKTVSATLKVSNTSKAETKNISCVNSRGN